MKINWFKIDINTLNSIIKLIPSSVDPYYDNLKIYLKIGNFCKDCEKDYRNCTCEISPRIRFIYGDEIEEYKKKEKLIILKIAKLIYYNYNIKNINFIILNLKRYVSNVKLSPHGKDIKRLINVMIEEIEFMYYENQLV